MYYRTLDNKIKILNIWKKNPILIQVNTKSLTMYAMVLRLALLDKQKIPQWACCKERQLGVTQSQDLQAQTGDTVQDSSHSALKEDIAITVKAISEIP